MSHVSESVKRVFDLASLRYEASKKLSAGEWQNYQQIRSRFDAERRFTERTYRAEYQVRVETARLALLHRAGAKSFEMKPRFGGVDRFDKAGLTRQSRRQVEGEHHSIMTKLDDRERQEIDGLLARAGQPRAATERTYNNVPEKEIERLEPIRSKPRTR